MKVVAITRFRVALDRSKKKKKNLLFFLFFTEFAASQRNAVFLITTTVKAAGLVLHILKFLKTFIAS